MNRNTFTDSHSIASAELSSSGTAGGIAIVSDLWADLRQTELERAKTGEYQPKKQATEMQIRKAALEFERRVGHPDSDGMIIPWVLVATHCDAYPLKKKVNNAVVAASKECPSTEIGNLSFFLANDKSLYIISFSDKQCYGAGIDCLMSAMIYFSDSIGGDLFHRHTNVVAQVDNGRTSPDGALDMMNPELQTEDGPLRAPFIAEIHSSEGKERI